MYFSYYTSNIADAVLLLFVTHEKSNDCNEESCDPSHKSDNILIWSMISMANRMVLVVMISRMVLKSGLSIRHTMNCSVMRI